MTLQNVPHVPHAENGGFAGKTGVEVETVGIEPTRRSPRERLLETTHLQGVCR